MTMVEKVARAIKESWRTAPGFDTDAEHQARCALRAMLDPTPEMVEAMVSTALKATLSANYTWPQYTSDLWTAAINAALEGETR